MRSALFALVAPYVAMVSATIAMMPAPANAQEPIQFGQSYVIDSEALGEARTINIWVPPHADMDERAPYRVLYLIDGGTEQDWFHITGLAQLGALSWTFQPMIVVGVETKDRQHELTPPASAEAYRNAFPTSGGADHFRAFLLNEVASFVESNFPTNGQSAIIGESLAGLFIVDTYLKAPDLFDDYIAISPSLWWDDKGLGTKASEFLNSGDREDKRLYLSWANEGGTMQDAIDQFTGAVQSAGLPLHLADYSATETHSTIFHQAALSAFRTLYAEPPYDYGATPWYMVEGGKP